MKREKENCKTFTRKNSISITNMSFFVNWARLNHLKTKKSVLVLCKINFTCQCIKIFHYDIFLTFGFCKNSSRLSSYFYCYIGVWLYKNHSHAMVLLHLDDSFPFPPYLLNSFTLALLLIPSTIFINHRVSKSCCLKIKQFRMWCIKTISQVCTFQRSSVSRVPL
jgi:hypothetical protein